MGHDRALLRGLCDAARADMDAEVARIASESVHAPNNNLRLLHAAPRCVLLAAHARLWTHMAGGDAARASAALVAAHDVHAARPRGGVAEPLPVSLAALEAALAHPIGADVRGALRAAIERDGVCIHETLCCGESHGLASM